MPQATLTHRPRTVAALLLPCVAIAATYLVAFAVPPLIRTLVDEEGISHARAGLLMTAFSLAYAAGGVPAGRLADRYGTARTLLAGTVVAGAAGLLCATTASLPALVGLRLAVGAGTALVLTAGILRIIDELPAERQAGGIGWITVAAYVGTGLAYLLVPLLVGPLGWRGVVGATGVAAIAAGLLAGVGPSREGTTRRPPGEPSAPVREVLGERRFLLVGAMLFLDLAALYGPLTWVPPFMEDVVHLSDGARSAVGTAMSLAAIPGALGAALVSRRASPAVVAGVSIALAIPVGLLALPAGESAAVIGVVGAVLVAGTNAATLPLFALAPGVVRPGAAGTAAGLATTVGLGGTVVSTYVGGLIVGSAGYGAAFAVYASAGLAGALLALPLSRALRGPGSPAGGGRPFDAARRSPGA